MEAKKEWINPEIKELEVKNGGSGDNDATDKS